MEKQIKHKKKMKFKTKREINALIFVLPWLIGLIAFFLIPLVQTFIMSFSADMETHFEFNGLDNYIFLFKDFSYVMNGQDYSFIRVILESLQMILLELPIIIIFSLFVAVLLNRKFKGRGLVRTIFFLPIIFGASIITQLTQSNATADYFTQIIGSQNLYQQLDVAYLFTGSGIPQAMINTLAGAVGRVFQIVAFSGVQILIFLSALQSINPTLYEVAKIEGANSYEVFWKITLPSITPIIITAVVYTFIDVLYRSPMTSVIGEVSKLTQVTGGGFGIASSISVIFLLITMILLGLILLLLRRVENGGKN